jgi:hypothetical protein
LNPEFDPALNPALNPVSSCWKEVL